MSAQHESTRSGSQQAEQGSQQAEQMEVARKCVWIFGVVGAIVLGTLVVAAFFGDTSSTFMWVRAALLLAMTPLLLWLARRAARGDLSALGRLRLVSTVLPIAIVGVDLIPGICPVWYASLQGLAALTLVPVAVLSWRLMPRRSGSARKTSRNV